jgi:DNA-binding transcriptional regulator YhcF (GntR family)
LQGHLPWYLKPLAAIAPKFVKKHRARRAFMMLLLIAIRDAINPATAAKGVNILVDEGILYKKRGIGMFVAEGAKENILNRRRNEFFDHYVKKLLEEAASIGLDKNEVIKLIQSADQ